MKGAAGCYVYRGIQGQSLRRGVEGHRYAAVGPGQPPAVDQQPQAAGLVEKGLQQLDACLPVAHAIVQQHAVLGIEAAVEVHTAQGGIVAQLQLGRGKRRVDAALGMVGQQCALFVGSAQLPAAKGNQPRQ
ncbi:hypothetical protein D3C81_1803140 [compost metagenome]